VLNVFKSPPVAKEVHRSDSLSGVASAYPRDTVTLGWEDRLKARALRRSDLGFEFATTLPRGTVLRENDCFVFDVPPVVVFVVERAEPVLVICPASPRDWGVFGYHIGNSHQPVMLAENEIVCADVPGMEQVLAYHGIPFTRDIRPFTPIGQIPDHQHQLSR
jgi:urease accessory protein UreE